jgi:quinohemoprotein ethanol dehydrogenase
MRSLRSVVAAAGLAAIIAAIPQAQSGSNTRTPIVRAPALSGPELAKLPVASWPTNGGDVFNRRYSPLSEIKRDNVTTLKGVWRTRLNGSGVGARYSGEAQPLVYEGVIYLATGADDVFAISVDSGEILWNYQAHLNPSLGTVCCGWTSRGVALANGKVFVGQLDGKLVALDQRSGDVAWSVVAERWQDGFSLTSAPLYIDGLVITGFAGAEYGTRGRVKAFDANDGHLVWTFYTIPGPGEIGHDTWPDTNDAWTRGGASVWQTPAADPELGLIYFSTGNAGPDFGGKVRAGDNLFSSSIVAIEAKTGKYRWHFQQVHHDIWDYDSPSPVVLFDLEINGRLRKAAAEPSKTGWVYILDRVTGKPLVGIEERPVPQEPRQATAKTQPFPVGDAVVPQSIAIAPEGFRLVNEGRIFTPYWTEPVVAKPAQSGGANWPASSYDPATGYLYVCATDRIGVFTSSENGGNGDDIVATGKQYLGGRFGSLAFTTTGIFAALDMHTNTLVWRQQWQDRCYSGSTTTGGGLVFVGRNDGRLTALDSRTGARLWEFQTGAGVNVAPTVFEWHGHEHVLVYSAGNTFAASPRGDSVWLLSLQGTLGPVDVASTQTSAAPPAGATAAPAVAAAAGRDADLNNGRVVFERACSACHGAAGEGGHEGPSLLAMTNRATVMRIVTEGRSAMPAFNRLLTAEEIRDVSAHVAESLKR